jgi:hypothetical protein
VLSPSLHPCLLPSALVHRQTFISLSVTRLFVLFFFITESPSSSLLTKKKMEPEQGNIADELANRLAYAAETGTASAPATAGGRAASPSILSSDPDDGKRLSILSRVFWRAIAFPCLHHACHRSYRDQTIVALSQADLN